MGGMVKNMGMHWVRVSVSMTENGVECVAENKDWKREKKECVCLTEGHVSIERGRERERERTSQCFQRPWFFSPSRRPTFHSRSRNETKKMKKMSPDRTNWDRREGRESACEWESACERNWESTRENLQLSPPANFCHFFVSHDVDLPKEKSVS